MNSVKATVLLILIMTINSEAVRIPESAHNLLLEANLSGNLDSFGKGLRGTADHIVYDNQTKEFMKESQFHEYGVGFGENLGIVAEDEAAWWMARWDKPIKANLIVLSGVFDNQPQPDTAWKIELRREGRWHVHARGVGGWYDGGRYVWGGPETEAVTFDALRVSIFSKDKQTSIISIHFRGEGGISWVVAYCPPIDARMAQVPGPIRAGEVAMFEAKQMLGDITSWQWDFGDGTTASGAKVNHTFTRPGSYDVRVVFSDGKDNGRLTRTVVVDPPVEARIRPLDSAVKVGHSVEFAENGSVGKITRYAWDFGDNSTAAGRRVRHVFAKAGIYKVLLTVSDETYSDECLVLVRVHTDETLSIPQVLLDTDQKNEQDDQHYLGYGLFSDLDILGVNSVHHGGGQEPVNYAEILNIIDLSLQS
ncbi:MAG: PKD domain-containing protein, partial [Planctomycetota bacterium]